jgi:hypothetical protein
MIKSTTLALAALIAVPVTTAPVVASDYWDWSMGSGNPTTRQKARAKYSKRYSKQSNPTKVMAYVKREGDEKLADRREFTCADKVRGLGTQWIGTEGAMDAAKKDWMERVRYDYGESYLDMTNSKDFVSRCGRVSIGETMGQVMYRCEIVARPCKGLMADTKSASK